MAATGGYIQKAVNPAAPDLLTKELVKAAFMRRRLHNTTQVDLYWSTYESEDQKTTVISVHSSLSLHSYYLLLLFAMFSYKTVYAVQEFSELVVSPRARSARTTASFCGNFVGS